LHKRARGKKDSIGTIAHHWTERIVQVTYADRTLKYYDTELLIKGSMALDRDLSVRLVPEGEADGKHNAFEVSSAGEKILFYSIMPNGARKWTDFLSNFNSTLDQRTIDAEKSKHLEWCAGVLDAARSHFPGNVEAQRLHLEGLLKTLDHTLETKGIDVSLLVRPEDMGVELARAEQEIRAEYETGIKTQLETIKQNSLAACRQILDLLHKQMEAVIFYATTKTVATPVAAVGAMRGSDEVLFNVPARGPIFSGNTASLKNWILQVMQAQKSVAEHFLRSKPYNDRLLLPFAKVAEEVGMYSAASIADTLLQLKALTPVPISLQEPDVAQLLAEFETGFMEKYPVRCALELCSHYSYSTFRGAVPLCAMEPAPTWQVDVTATVSAASQTQSFDQVIQINQIEPTPPSPPPPPSLDNVTIA